MKFAKPVFVMPVLIALFTATVPDLRGFPPHQKRPLQSPILQQSIQMFNWQLFSTKSLVITILCPRLSPAVREEKKEAGLRLTQS